jgi:acetylornithine deacetylase
MVDNNYFSEAISLLREVVSTPSVSGEENEVSNLLCNYLSSKGCTPERIYNNIIVNSRKYDSTKKILMLNSHMDTVKPLSSYTFDPYDPHTDSEKIFGLGSNDAGASLVSMIQTFLFYEERDEKLPFNLMLLISAEEETSGKRGIKLALRHIMRPDCAIVGEPTSMNMAIGERGLLVVDALAKGVCGHAARNEGINAIMIALDDINWIKDYKFPLISEKMGEVRCSVTQIEAGTQHNVIPDNCKFVIDIRPTDCYTNNDIMEILKAHMKSELKARSLTNKSSLTPYDHPLIEAAEACGIKTYISPTTSDWMRLDFPAVKMGPGDSSRSHRADEFVWTQEIKDGIEGYIKLISKLKL